MEKCKSCVYAVGGKAPSTSSVLLKMAGIVAVIVLATLFGWFTYHKKRYIIFGSVATLLVIGSYVFAIEKYKNKEYPVQSCDSSICITDSLNAVSTIDSLNPFVADNFLPAGGEFEDLSEFTAASDDEFSEISSELNEFSDNESEVSQTPIDKTDILSENISHRIETPYVGLSVTKTLFGKRVGADK